MSLSTLWGELVVIMFTKIKNFFKNYWIFILLAAVVVILGAIKLTQPKVKGPTPAPLILPPFSPPQIMGDPLPSDTKISIEKFNFPSKMKTYQGEPNKISSDKAKEIASSLGFTNPPQISEDVFQGKFHSWSTTENFLSIGLDSSRISYGKNLRLHPPPTTESLPPFSEAQEIFNNFIKKVKVDLPQDYRFQNPKFLAKKGTLLKETTLDQADFIQAGINLAIDGYQILSQDPDTPSAYVLIGKDKNVYRFEYFVPLLSFSAKDSYQIKSLEEIKSSIISEAKIVSYKTEEENYVIQGLSGVNLNEISLVFFEPISKENLVIQPIFVLAGKGISPDGNVVELKAYLPAVSFGKFTPLSPTPESKFKL